MSLRADLDSLLLYDPSRARSTVNVWVARPNSPEESAYGKLFLISAIDTSAHVNHEIIGILQDELRSGFFRPEPQTVDRRFQEAVQATNRRLHAMIADGVNDWVSRAHFLAGAIHGENLVLAPVGTVHAYLLRGYRLHDILGISDQTTPNPLRIFSEVVNGQVQAGERILLCLPSLLDYFSLEKLRRTLLDHRPSEAARLLEQSLVDVDPSMSFGALLFSINDETEPAPEIAPLKPHLVLTQRQAPQKSMADLINTERSTEKILAPSIWPAIRQVATMVGRAADAFIRTTVLRRPPRRTMHFERGLSDARPSVDRPRPTSGPTFVAGAVGWLSAAFRGLPSFFRRLRPPSRNTNYTNYGTVPPSARSSGLARTVQWWQRTTRPQRIIAGSLLILVILFTSYFARHATSPNISGQRSTPEEVRSLLDQAQAAIGFKGEALARDDIAQAAAKLATLPNKSKDEKAVYNDLNATIENLRGQLTRRVTLTAGTLMSDLSSVVAGIQPSELSALAGYIVALDGRHSTVVRIDVKTKTAIKAETTLDIGSLLLSAPLSSTVVFLTDRPGLIEYTPKTDTWKPFDAAFPSTRPTAQALATFETRLYLLDRAGNQILRFTRAGTSYGTGTNWLKDTVSLENAVDLAVDGSVYVLRSTGAIDEYFSGRHSTFALGTIDPPLTTATHLWTSATSTRLYVLDPKEKRIVLFDKHGALVRQLTSTDWDAPTAFTVDEANKVIYVLTGTKVIRYALPS